MSLSASKRYETDSTFRVLVDTLYNMIDKAQYTPSELREAVILAATRYEMLNIRPIRIRIDDFSFHGSSMADGPT